MALNLITLVLGAALCLSLGSAQPVDWAGFLTKTPPIYTGDVSCCSPMCCLEVTDQQALEYVCR